MSGALEILVSIGFRESENGSLSISMDTNIKELVARKLEIETGLEMLRTKVLQIDSEDKGKLSTEGSMKKNTANKVDINKAGSIPVKANVVASSSPKVQKSPRTRESSVLQEERSKRIRAEASLQQQKTVLRELQNQVDSLKATEQKTISIREDLTLARMTADHSTNLQTQLREIGKEEFERNNDQLTKSKMSSAKKNPMEAKASGVRFSTFLVSIARAGENRLEVQSLSGLKKGMRIIVGNGTKAECHTVKGFGSIIIDEPLSNTHPVGSSIVAFPSSSKYTKVIEQCIIKEMIHGIFFDELLPLIVRENQQQSTLASFNTLYAKRPMWKDVYTINSEKLIQIGNGAVTAAKCYPSSSIAVARNTGLHFLRGGFTIISSFYLFLVIHILECDDISQLQQPSPIENTSLIDTESLMKLLNYDKMLSSIFQQLAELNGFTEIDRYIKERFGNVDGKISLARWCSAIQTIEVVPLNPRHLPLLSTLLVERQDFELLSSIFTLTDCDRDGSLSVEETVLVFGELDGSPVKMRTFNKVITQVVGYKLESTKLSLEVFLKVRKAYAISTNTPISGVCVGCNLEIVRCIRLVAITQYDGNLNCVPVTEILGRLPSIILDAKVIDGSTVQELLQFRSEPFDMKSLLRGPVSLMLSDLAYYFAGSADPSSYEVKQIVCGPNYKFLYTLTSNGVLHMYDSSSGEKLVQSRVMWNEPLPVRKLEGSSTYNKWKIDNGFSPDPHIEQTLNAIEVDRQSCLISRFISGLPTESGSSNLVAIDQASGLIAVNCGIISHSICFYEPLSLRRLYRIKAPSKCSSYLEETIRKLSCGEGSVPTSDVRICEGCISSFEIVAFQTLLLCLIACKNNFIAVSFLNGDILLEFSGHSAGLTCLAISKSSTIMTGSTDGTVRLWCLDDCLPSALSGGQTLQDSSVALLEERVISKPATGTISNLRLMLSHLCTVLEVSPIWKRAKIIAYITTTGYSIAPEHRDNAIGTEILLEDSSVKVVTENLLLRNVAEMSVAPTGPPLWSAAPADNTIGNDVAIFDLDVDILATVCACRLKHEIVRKVPLTVLKSTLERMLTPYDWREADIDAAFQSLDLYGDKMEISLLRFFKKLLKNQNSKLLNHTDRLLIGCSAPIVSVTFLESCKLFVAVDRSGICSVWDPNSSQAMLTLDHANNIFIGTKSFDLVICKNLVGGRVSADWTIKHLEFSKIQIKEEDIAPSFVSGRELIDCFSLEEKFSSISLRQTNGETPLRGFIYVFEDFTSITVDTSCFIPELVLFNSASDFLSASLFLSEIVTTDIQEIYRRRRSIVRIVYVISLSHSNWDELLSDFKKYNIVQRGVVSIPSDNVFFRVFENKGGVLDRRREETTTTIVKSGLIIALKNSPRGRMYDIACNYSNDIQRVEEKDIVGVYNRSVSNKKIYDPLTGYATGIFVDFEKTISKRSILSPLYDIGILFVFCENDVDSRTVALPIKFGKSAFPVPAKFIATALSDSTKESVGKTLIAKIDATIGRNAAVNLINNLSRAKWLRDLRLVNYQFYQALHVDPAKAKGGALTTTSLYATIPFLEFVLNLVYWLWQKKVHRSHPLLGYLSSVLGSCSNELSDRAELLLATASSGKYEKFNLFVRDWLCRHGVFMEEIIHKIRLVDSSNVKELDMLVSQYENKHNSVENLENGTVVFTTVQLAALFTAKSKLRNKFDDISDVSGTAINLRNEGNLIKLLRQHHMSLKLGQFFQSKKEYIRLMEHVLKKQLVDAIQPILYSIRSTSSSSSRTVKSRQEFFHTSNSKPMSGQYNVVQKQSFGSLIPGIICELCRIIKVNTTSPVYDVLVWKYESGESAEASLLYMMKRLSQFLSSVECSSILKSVDGISFTAEVNSPCLLFDWPANLLPLSSLVEKRGGMFRRERTELLRLIASNLLHALVEIDQNETILKCVSPETVYLVGTDVFLYVLPTFQDSTFDKDSLEKSADITNLYSKQGRSFPLLTASIPRDNSTQALEKWDIWSFGVTLFYLSFGFNPITDSMHSNVETSEDGIIGSVMYELIRPLLNIKNNDQTESIATTLQAILAEPSKSILIRIARDYCRTPMENLSQFRVSFCNHSIVCGLTDYAAASLWEQIVQNIFHKIHNGKEAIDKLVQSLSVTPRLLTLDEAKDFMCPKLGLSLNSGEFKALLDSLIGEEEKGLPFTERMVKSIRKLVFMMEEIHFYGNTQQLIYIISECFNSNPSERPSFRELEQLSFFNITGEGDLLRAAHEASLLASPFQTVADFTQSLIIGPLADSFACLVFEEVLPSLERVSRVMTYIEELIQHFSAEQSKTERELSKSIQTTGVDLVWLQAHYKDILVSALDHDIFRLITLLVIRFVNSSHADKLSSTSNNTKRRSETSLGAKLLFRMTTFLQQLLASLNSTAHSLSFSKVFVDDSLKSSNRMLMESLFNACLESVLMLYLGEEAGMCHAGSYAVQFFDVYSMEQYGDSFKNLEAGAVQLSCCWESRISSIFEPLLMSIIGEDGRGTSKFAFSLESIRQSDYYLEMFSTLVTSSIDEVQQNGKNKTAVTLMLASPTQTRGSTYYNNLPRLVKAIVTIESMSGKMVDRAHQSLISATTLLLPAPENPLLCVLDGSNKTLLSTSINSNMRFTPDGSLWQKVQLILDLRIAARFQSFFARADSVTRMLLLKTCHRIFALCISLTEELASQEPFLSLGQEFSGSAWVSALVEVLKSKSNSLESMALAASCLRLMSYRKCWMRCWSVFNTLPILLVGAKMLGKNALGIKTESLLALKHANVSNSEGTFSLVSLKYQNLELIEGLIGLPPVSTLIADANDISFGSTLAEQEKFANHLMSWLDFAFPCQFPYLALSVMKVPPAGTSQGKQLWEPLFLLAHQITAWLPKLCLGLFITDTRDTVKKEKTNAVGAVALKQIQAIGRIVLHSLASQHERKDAFIINCLWSPNETNDLLISDVESATLPKVNGLLMCLDSLLSTGTTVDPFIALKLEIEIIKIVLFLLRRGSPPLLNLLYNYGIVRTVVRFIISTMDLVNNIVRNGQQGVFAREQQNIQSILLECWCVLVSIKDNLKSSEQLIECGVLEMIVNNWLPSALMITIASNDKSYNPLVIRYLSMRMIQITVLLAPNTDRLLAEFARIILLSDTIQRDLRMIQAVNTKKSFVNTRKLTAECLATLASFQDDLLDQQWKVRMISLLFK